MSDRYEKAPSDRAEDLCPDISLQQEAATRQRGVSRRSVLAGAAAVASTAWSRPVLPSESPSRGVSNLNSNRGENGNSTLFFSSSKVPSQWDTWVYFHEGTFYAFYLTGIFLHWDGVGLAVSRDGVHWLDHGRILEKAAGVTWLGSGAIWRSGEKFIMNFSEWRGPAPEGGRDTIFFAESTDLLQWTRLDSKYEFQQDPRWYSPNGRWDCIWPVPRPDGGYYGYWTATPKDGSAGVGFGESLNGTDWKALPPVKLANYRVPPEIGSVVVQNRKYYAMVSALEGDGMDTLIADRPEGSFVPAVKNRRLLVGNASYFTRFVNVPDGVLVNHHSWETGPVFAEPEDVYMAPFKRAVWDDEGTLRLKWWDGNESAKAVRIRIASRLSESVFDPTKPLILEGVMSLDWKWWGPIQAPGLYIQGVNGQGTAILAYSNSVVAYGDSHPDGTYFDKKGGVDRELPMEKKAHFRLVRKGRMTEFYLNDFLMQCYCLPDRGTGRIDVIGDAKVESLQGWYSV